MIISETDKKAAKTPASAEVSDRNESTSRMQPMRITESSPHRRELTDLTLELTALSAGFRSSLPEGVVTALADLVRAMNCYYNNLGDFSKSSCHLAGLFVRPPRYSGARLDRRRLVLP